MLDLPNTYVLREATILAKQARGNERIQSPRGRFAIKGFQVKLKQTTHK